MKKKTKVELGVLAGCVVLLGGSTIAVNSNKSEQKPNSDSSVVEEYVSSVSSDFEISAALSATSEVMKVETNSSTIETTAAETLEITPPVTTIVTTVGTTQATSVATTPLTTSEKKVYIADSGEGGKYHRKPDCGNMDGAIEITISEAEALGYTPCKRCYY